MVTFVEDMYVRTLTYVLGAAFAVWALSRCISFSRGTAVAAGAAGSITLVGVLMAAGCFLIGCCGSPMLAIYLGLFGAKVLGLGKLLTATYPSLLPITHQSPSLH
jgi:hypothetical protein